MKRRKLQYVLSFLIILTILLLPFFIPSAAKADTTPNITYLGSTSGNGAFVGSGVSLTVPTNVSTGDFLVAVVGTNGINKVSWTVPFGWHKGPGSKETNQQGIFWWWKIASNSDAGSQVTIQSSSWEDGGANILAFHGINPNNPFAAVSTFQSYNNDGVGNVTSAVANATSWSEQEPVISLILTSWQSVGTTLSFPSGYTFVAGADDGFSYQAILLQVTPPTTTGNLPSETIGFANQEAVISTLQIALEAQ